MGKRKHYSKTSVKFPIEIRMKILGNVMEYRMNKGDEVECRFCGEKIVLGNETVFKYRHKYDNGAKIYCQNCEHVMDAAYYASDENRVRITAWDAKFVKTEMEAANATV